MTDQEINSAIEQALGFKMVEFRAGYTCAPGEKFEGTGRKFCSDLNAIHEEVEKLTPPQKLVFGEILNEIVGAFFDDYYTGWGGNEGSFAESMTKLVQATARQRAEALLRTLNK